MPKLYTADLLDIAVPVKKDLKETKESEQPKELKGEKKPRTEKQIAALEKAKEARRLKKETKEQEQANDLAIKELAIKTALENETKIVEKKAMAAEKRRLAKEAKKQVILTPEPSIPESPDVDVAEPVKEKKTRKRKSITVIDPDEVEPPKWFSKYVEGVKQEQNIHSQERKPKKQVKVEANEDAKTQWQDGHTRDRLNNELNNHAARMYGMIFGNRKM